MGKIQLSGHYSYKRILRTIVPSIIMVFVISTYNIVDGIFVSNFVGKTAFAAINLVMPVIMIVGALGLMLGSGGSALVSKILGEGNANRAQQVFSMVVFTTIIIGVICSLLLYVLMPLIVTAMGVEQGEMYTNSVFYARFLLISLTPFMLQLMFQTLYMTAELPVLGTKMSIVCGIIHVALDAIFILIFDMGLAGAALATVISQFVGGIFPVLYFMSKKNGSNLRILSCKIELRPILKASSNGLSEFMGNVALSVVSICYNYQLLRYVGETGVIAYGIIMIVGFFFVAIPIGYNIATMPIIGYNYGAQNRPEIRSLLHKSLVLMLIFGVLMTIVAELTSSQITRIFVGYNADLFNFTLRAFRIYMISCILCGVNLFVSALFTGLNNGIVSAVQAFTRTIIFEVGSVFLLPIWLGIDGIWLAVNITELLTAIFSAGLLFYFRKRYWL